MKVKLKKIVLDANKKGKLLWVRPLLSIRRKPFQFPSKRYVFLFNYLILLITKKCLPLDWESHGSVFYICLLQENGNSLVRKLPRLDNRWSHALQKSLQSEQSYIHYSELLRGLKDEPYLEKHVPEVYSINRNGGYDSELIQGHNLSDILSHFRYKRKIPDSIEGQVLVSAIQELIQNLKKYWESTNHLSGDWALHNLIFEDTTNSIKNVDLEGFYTYGENTIEAQPDYILAELRTLESILNLLSQSDDESRKKLMILNTVWYTTESGVSYDGSAYFAGYHSFNLRDSYFRGQRECTSRLAEVPYDFNDKVVLDIGCNCGGMLHSIADKITTGIGFDKNTRCINAANLIRQYNGTANLQFYSFDFESDNLGLINDYILGQKIDICFLLSMCMWLKNWRDVVELCALTAKSLLFESNGSASEQIDQITHVKKCFKKVSIIAEDSPDDPGQKNRKFYLCQN